MDKKYQIFISSTYRDLVDERRKILDVLLMADCIPAGMEAFVATDAEQFEVIKKVINLCDYYILIIGKRYGSVNPETGLSYTEMEYNYALEKEIPVLVFALDNTVDVAPEKQEQDDILRKKLRAFRERAMRNRLASEWENVDDLVGKVAISVMKAKAEIDRPGWQRASECNEIDFRRKIMELQEENDTLKKELSVKTEILKSFDDKNNLAFEDCDIVLKGKNGLSKTNPIKEIKTTLKKIFVVMATEMMNIAIPERHVKIAIERNFFSSRLYTLTDAQLIKRLLCQCQKLGLLECKIENGAESWGLTPKGKKIRDEEILITKRKNN